MRKSPAGSVAQAVIRETTGYDVQEALVRIDEMLSEGTGEEQIRAALPWVPKRHWEALFTRAQRIRETLNHAIPAELRQQWVRAKLNRIADEGDPATALKALAQISKDPELQLTARTSSIHIDLSTASRLEELSKERVHEIKATEGLTLERNPKE